MIPSDRRYTLEVTGKDVGQISAAHADIAPGTPINVAFLGNEDHTQRVRAAQIIREFGFEPVPILSSRRLRSQRDLDALLDALVQQANPRRVLVVGGDPATPAGPYADAPSLLKSGVLQRHAIRHVGIVAYPEGHPKIDKDTLWRALRWKVAFLRDAGCSVEITTQFGFDADAVLGWLERLRGDGIDAAVRIGVPGPADVGKLLRFARQFGVAASAEIVRKYGFSLANLLHRVGPELFLGRLRTGMAGRDLGTVLFHLYPFGGIADGVRWMNRHACDSDARPKAGNGVPAQADQHATFAVAPPPSGI